jgi:hypothetical protein
MLHAIKEGWNRAHIRHKSEGHHPADEKHQVKREKIKGCMKGDHQENGYNNADAPDDKTVDDAPIFRSISRVYKVLIPAENADNDGSANQFTDAEEGSNKLVRMSHCELTRSSYNHLYLQGSNCSVWSPFARYTGQ